ncbi:hypothetical protein GOB43_17980 [Sinorhizobium meliloti]|uniref:lysozyme n=1 Tax=Rhizobium meliloti TaxID=382 RepID=UPI000FDA1520|nr:phage tail length tape measure family protein [Sinorhizobium meliloti]MDW9409558.1 hypothetical protein [Sinorhizobium meliloti]MDW9440918.1 hypothetical protein [Sinorhizobium meliloti]MDW9454980.1 hypothetical protein [Sinorhizobium meliloti]MDW9467142.1 hypothetical protein [Sinorhizobium meliloti]MDW9519153.1 hypothetical protein [Sinorhizobium meliloti]
MPTDLEALVLSISADTAQVRRSLERLTGDAKKTAADIEKAFSGTDPFGGLSNNFSKSSKAVAADARNLQFQLNDVFTQMASGTDVLRALSMQAGQIGQTLTGGGLAGGLKTVQAALLGMLNPITLMATALPIASYAITKFFDDAEDGSTDARNALEKQLAALDAVVARYADAVPTLKKIRDEAQDAADKQKLQEETARQQAEAYAALKKTFGDMLPTVQDFQSRLEQAGETDQAAELRRAYDELNTKIKENRASAADLVPLIERLKELHRLYRTDGVDPLIQSLEAQNKALDDAATKAKKLAQDMDGVLGKLRSLSSMQIQFQQLDPLISRGGEIEILTPGMESQLGEYRRWVGEATGLTAQFIKDRERFMAKAYSDKRESTGKHDAWRVGFGSDTYVDELGRVQRVTQDTVITLEQANADLGRRIGEFQATIQRQIGPEFWKSLDEQQKAALTSLAYNYGSLPAAIVKAIKEGDRGQVAQAIANLPATTNKKRRQMEAELYGGGVYTPAREAAKSRKQGFEEMFAENQRRLDQMNQEIAVRGNLNMSIDQQTFLIEKQRIAEELLAAAKRDGTAVTDELRSKIDQQAASMAAASLRTQHLKEGQRSLSQTSKQLAQQQAQMVTAMAQSAIGGLVNDLRNGVSAGEAFTNVLNRVIDGLVNMAIQAMFSQQALGGVIGNFFGLGGGGFPGAAPGVGLYHSGGTVGSKGASRRVSPFVFAGAPRMHNGGLVPGEVPIIAQRGELVVPKSALRRPVAANSNAGNVYLGDVTIDVSTGMVTANNRDAALVGERINKAVQAVLVAESRPGGLLRRVPS